jgi:uncharacterized protein
MAVKLRLMRMGKTKQPTYRIVAADSRSPRAAPGRPAHRPCTAPARNLGHLGRVQGQVMAASAPTANAVLTFLVKQLVEEPDAVTIEEVEGRRGNVQLEVRTADGDMGRVIGRRGRTAQSIRTVVRAAAAKDGVDVDVDFAD